MSSFLPCYFCLCSLGVPGLAPHGPQAVSGVLVICRGCTHFLPGATEPFSDCSGYESPMSQPLCQRLQLGFPPLPLRSQASWAPSCVCVSFCADGGGGATGPGSGSQDWACFKAAVPSSPQWPAEISHCHVVQHWLFRNAERPHLAVTGLPPPPSAAGLPHVPLPLRWWRGPLSEAGWVTLWSHFLSLH